MKKSIVAVIVSGVLLTGIGTSAAAAADRPARPATAERPDRRLERLRLACRPATNGDQRGIGCRWSASQHPQFASYRLVRATEDGRQVVFRTDDRTHTRFLDTNVERGVRYRYAVLAFDAEDHLIGRSRVVNAGLPAE